MSLISQENLKRLMTAEGEWCVSLYLPTHRAGNDVAQNRIRLKNLIDEAREQLLEQGLSEGDTNALLGELEEQLIPQPLFWQHQLEGLAIFRSPDLLLIYRLPYSVDSLAIISRYFHIKPLLPLLATSGQFYLLTLHEGEINFYQGNRHTMRQVEVEEIPEGAADLIRDRDDERPQQWRTDVRDPGGALRARQRPAAFHGHGVMEQREEDDILRYFRKIDEVLNPLFDYDDQVPLVLAGIDDLVPLYHQANTYPYLVENKAITVDPSRMDLSELHHRAWEILEPRFTAEQEEAADAYRILSGRDDDQASDDLEEIVSAAYFERVDFLWVPLGLQKWGTFDPDTGEVEVHAEREAGDRDLLDLAAVHTVLNSGTVYAVEPGEIPGDGEQAAIFRY